MATILHFIFLKDYKLFRNITNRLLDNLITKDDIFNYELSSIIFNSKLLDKKVEDYSSRLLFDEMDGIEDNYQVDIYSKEF